MLLGVDRGGLVVYSRYVPTYNLLFDVSGCSSGMRHLFDCL